MSFRLAVADSGIGISAEDQERLFQPFSQADASTSRKFGGTGLGLALCRRIVDGLGGSIDVMSEAGKGSVFTVSLELPVDHGQAATLASSSVPQRARVPALEDDALAAPIRVLLAEDNPVNQVVARKMLEGMGATVVVTADGAQALEALETSAFDVVLMDCQMPGMDGFAATARIRERDVARGGHTPVVAMTANAFEGAREQCLAAGMDDYVSKPITRQGLWAILSRHTRSSAAVSAGAGGALSQGPAHPAAHEGVDVQRFAEMKEILDDGAGGFYEGILQPFLSITEGQLRELEQSLEKGDVRAVQTIAHTVKGSSLNLGFVGLGRRARQVEAEAKEGRIGDPGPLTAALQDEFRRLSLFTELHRSGAGRPDDRGTGARSTSP